MCVTGQRIEEQVGQPVARQVLVQSHSFAKDQATAVDASCFGLRAQVPGGSRIVFKQPQHAAFHCGENTHPAIEGRGQYLVVVVEAAEDKPRGRQSKFLLGEDAI